MSLVFTQLVFVDVVLNLLQRAAVIVRRFRHAAAAAMLLLNARRWNTEMFAAAAAVVCWRGRHSLRKFCATEMRKSEMRRLWGEMILLIPVFLWGEEERLRHKGWFTKCMQMYTIRVGLRTLMAMGRAKSHSVYFASGVVNANMMSTQHCDTRQRNYQQNHHRETHCMQDIYIYHTI